MGIYSNEPEFSIKSLFHFLGDWGPSFLEIHLWNNITEDKLKKKWNGKYTKTGFGSFVISQWNSAELSFPIYCCLI